MTKLNPKTIAVGAIFLLLIGYLAFTTLTGSDPVARLTGAGQVTKVTEETADSRVPNVITDPFFHPSVQQVAPNGAPSGAVSPPSQTVTPAPPMAGNLNGGNVPIQPMAPSGNDPYGGLGPGGSPAIQPLPGNLPDQMPNQSSGAQGQAPNQVVSTPEAPVKVQVQGLVVGASPSAFVRINDGSSQKVASGTKLEGGVVVIEISEQTVTFSRKGKKASLRPGQAENL